MRKIVFALLVIAVTLMSFAVVRPTATPDVKAGKSLSKKEITKAYIKKYLNLAIEESMIHNIPVSIILGQAILESSSGTSRMARNENNHFGIKWRGKGKYGIYNDDSPTDRFQHYSSVWWSYRHHSKLLALAPRYKHLTKLPREEYKKWAKGLKKAGYATEPKYAQILIKVIEQYDLHHHDIRITCNLIAKKILRK